MSYKQNGHQDYKEYPTSRGEILKIHAVPQPIIRAVVPDRPKPELPLVDMQIKGGVQKRPAKPGDSVWDTYTTELKEWEAERDDLQEAITFCMALKSYPYPENLTLSPDVQQLVDMGLLKLPNNPFIRKFMWIRENVLGEHDEYNVKMMLHELSGVPGDIVDEMRRNFRNILLGQATRPVGEQVEVETSQSEEVIQEQ